MADALAGLWSQPGKVHLIGAGGVGMAGLARLLLQEGFRVSGSDTEENALLAALREEGAEIGIGHAAGHIAKGTAWGIRTPAVDGGNAELCALRDAQIPVYARGDILAAYSRRRRTAAVAGAHGKTTTAAMLAHGLRASGIACGYAIGGVTSLPGGVADQGRIREFVCEADESDGTLMAYTPEIGLLTHVEWDHVERFRTEEDLLACYARFARQCGTVILRGEDPLAVLVTAGHPHVLRAGEVAGDMQTRDDPGGQRVRLRLAGKPLSFRLPLPGRHNAENARMALVAACELGADPEAFAASLSDFVSVGRRFERLRVNGVEVVHDYAHHPTEIAALLHSARALGGERVVMAFQPHRFSRTRHLLDAFAGVLSEVDLLHLLPVYSASEARALGVDSDALAEKCAAIMGSDRVRLHPDSGSLRRAAERELRPGDVFLIVGAGNIVSVFESMKQRRNQNGGGT